jgi:hypothetical protein
MHDAPEIDVHQPVHLRLLDLAELAEQSDAGIVDENVEGRVGRDRSLREIGDLRGLADIDAMRGDLLLAAVPAASICKPASSRSASARSQPRAASAIANARPMPLAAPVTAAADPRITVMSVPSWL